MERALLNEVKLEHIRQKDPESNRDIKFVAAPAIIAKVSPWSLAAEYGLKAGDQILEISKQKLRDIMDFNFEFAQADRVELLIRRKGKLETETLSIDKDFDDELGAEFTTPLFNGVRECANKCPFCFVDQQPLDQTRESLHLKDDDFRLSYLHGSYVTLTNLSFSDRRRIETLRPGPLYVSVHATAPELRNIMLGRKKSPLIIDELKWLDSLDIPCHTQIVLCPGLNDGEHLLQTINELYELRNKPVLSVAIVPVGLTKYHNAGLRRFSLDEALETISLVEAWEQASSKKRKRFVFLSDEFYLMTGTPIPDKDYYGNYPQLEDGVGMTRLFINELDQELKRINKRGQNHLAQKKTISWINGTIAKPVVDEAAKKLNAVIKNLDLRPLCLESEFWGTTNVTGLLTGQDLLTKLKKLKKEDLGETLIIPKVMLKDGEDVFLDDLSLQKLEEELGVTCVKAWGAAELIQIIFC